MHAILPETESTHRQGGRLDQVFTNVKWLNFGMAWDENNQPDRLVAHARQYLAGRPLPRVLILDATGSFVADAELPKTPDAVQAWLADRGVK